MIKSMTGYGIASLNSEQGNYSVEIKSLNSKYLELNLKIPKAFSDKELFLRNECTRLLERGKISVTVTAESDDPTAKAASINADLVKYYYNQLIAISRELGAPQENLLGTILSMPEVVSYQEERADEQEWEKVYQ